MSDNYKRTFDAVVLPQNRSEQIKDTISSRISEIRKENNEMNFKPIKNKKSRLVLIAAVIALSSVLLAGVAVAYSTQIIDMLTGGYIEIGDDFASITTYEANVPYEVINGRVIFTLDGSNKDITDYISEETYYEYEYTAENGWHFIVHVGGTPDNLGWQEFIFDENGDRFGSTGMYTGDEEPVWFTTGRAELGAVPWGVVEE